MSKHSIGTLKLETLVKFPNSDSKNIITKIKYFRMKSETEFYQEWPQRQRHM